MEKENKKKRTIGDVIKRLITYQRNAARSHITLDSTSEHMELASGAYYEHGQRGSHGTQNSLTENERLERDQ